MLTLLLGTIGVFLYLTISSSQENTKCPLELGPRQGSFATGTRLKSFFVQKYVKARIEGPSTNIPYNIFQTNELDEVPFRMKYSIDTVIMKNPQFTYRFFNSTERRAFIKEHIGKTVLDCYDKLRPPAYKADFFRYLVVYTFGGCYMDAGFIAIDSLSTIIRPEYNFVSTDDAGPDFALNSAFFCATSRHKILQNTINLLVKNINQEYRGRDSIDVTGPRRFVVGFKEYFQLGGPLVIETRQYINGILLLRRFKEQVQCLISTVQENSGRVIFYNKYPNYYIDMDLNTAIPHYGAFWVQETVYDKSIKPLDAQTFRIETSVRLNDTLTKDSMIPMEYRS